MPLVISKSNKYIQKCSADIDDFIQESMFALYNAAEKYNNMLQASFATYASVCISNRLMDYVRAFFRSSSSASYISLDELDENLVSKLSGNFNQKSVEDIYINNETVNARKMIIKTLLSDFEQQVLDMYLSGNSYKHISRKLNVDLKAVDNALQRVRRKLKPDMV